jgi:hypothetical protein
MVREESMYRLVCPEFQFDFIYEYASPALKAKVRNPVSETTRVRRKTETDCTHGRRVSDILLTRKDIRLNYFLKVHTLGVS